MTLHLRTQDERFCGSCKNFRNPLLVVGLGSAVKAPSEAARTERWRAGSVDVSKNARLPRAIGSYVAMSWAQLQAVSAVEQLVRHEASLSDAMKIQDKSMRYIGRKCSPALSKRVRCAF